MLFSTEKMDTSQKQVDISNEKSSDLTQTVENQNEIKFKEASNDVNLFKSNFYDESIDLY